MPSFYTFALLAIFSLLALFMIAMIAREARARLKAGPTRFRLPLASLANPPRGTEVTSIIFLISALMLIPAAMSGRDPSTWVFPMLFPWLAVNNLQSLNPRRDARRWLVLASGLLVLVPGTMLLAIGSRNLHAGNAPYGLPAWFPFCWSFPLFVSGAAAIQEFASGTRVREGGIEMFATTYPWSRIVVKGWHAREGGFALRLFIASPRLFDVPCMPDRELIVPVPASERPALEDFLAGRTATAG
jgi:hypothetical protein